jgi:hypothetical protein
MLDYYSVSGCYILKPWSYSIWEEIQGQYLSTSPFVLSSHTQVRLVQQKNQGDGCPKFILPDVCVGKGVGARKGPH